MTHQNIPPPPPPSPNALYKINEYYLMHSTYFIFIHYKMIFKMSPRWKNSDKINVIIQMAIFRFWLENIVFFPNNDYWLAHMQTFLKSILVVRSVNINNLCCCCLLSYTFQQDIRYLLDYMVIIFTVGFLDHLDTVTF